MHSHNSHTLSGLWRMKPSAVAHPTFPPLCSLIPRLLRDFLSRHSCSSSLHCSPNSPCMSLSLNVNPKKSFHLLLCWIVSPLPPQAELTTSTTNFTTGVLNLMNCHITNFASCSSDASSSSPSENREIQYELLSLLQGHSEIERARETERDKWTRKREKNRRGGRWQG